MNVYKPKKEKLKEPSKAIGQLRGPDIFPEQVCTFDIFWFYKRWVYKCLNKAWVD